MAIHIRRREFIFTLGGAAVAWPLAARAQQPAIPVVGVLRSGALTDVPDRVTALRQGLEEAGFVEGQNVAIEYRWGEFQTAKRLGLLRELRPGTTRIAVLVDPKWPLRTFAKLTASIGG
jgi:hypothetical protein